MTFKQIPSTEITLLWHVDYWDGPLSGILLFANEYCWFKVIDNRFLEPTTCHSNPLRIGAIIDESEDPRKFIVIRLTAEQLLEEQYWHNLFCENVRGNTGLRPREQWDNFYGPYKNRKPQDFSSNDILGWFEQ